MTAPERAVDLVVRGRVVLPDRVLDDGYVAVEGGRIAAIGETAGGLPHARRAVEAGGAYVLPGIVDSHVHARSDPAEGITRCTASAVAGGVTTIVDMPFDAPAAVPDLETFERKIAAVAREAVGDVALYGTIRKQGGLGEIARLAGAGACAFKLSTFESHPVRFPRIPDGEMLEAFRLAAAVGVPVAVHCENQEIIEQLTAHAEAAGDAGPLAHCRTRPPVSETEAVARVLELAHHAGAHVHIVHASVPRSFDLVERYRADGVRATAETCVQYLVLDERAMERLGPLAKINPPLRGPADVDGLWRYLTAGRIDQVTSDHAPWSRAHKNDRSNIFKNGSGAPGVETLLPLLHDAGVATGRLSILDLVRLLAEHPARNFHLFPRKGALAPGADADLVVFDPNASWTIRGDALHSSAGWTPYEGMTVRGRVRQTFVRGRLAYDGAEVVARPGDGEFIPRLRTSAEAAAQQGRG